MNIFIYFGFLGHIEAVLREESGLEVISDQ